MTATPENTTYTANPSSGWTEVPEPDKTIGSIIYHGGLLQAQATISGSTATFTLKKNDGSQFNNDGSIMVFYGSLGGTIIKSSTYYGGVRNLSIDIKLDFISGSKKYIIAIISGKTFYYTNPITITANGSSTDVDLVIADGSLFFNTEILTTGYGHTFNVKVKNNGSTTWKGHFFLKRGKGTPNLLSWYDVEINAGETKDNPNAVNTNSNTSIDRGLFQLNSNSFPNLTEADFYNPKTSAKYGLSHLRFCLDTAGNEIAALAMYNAGTKRVRSNGTPQMTLNYVSGIINYRNGLEELFTNQVIAAIDKDNPSLLALLPSSKQ